MAILRSSPSVPRPDPAPAELAAALARLCEREGLDASETAGVLAVALTWALGLPRDPTPLLRLFSMVSWSIFGLDGISVVRRLESGRSE